MLAFDHGGNPLAASGNDGRVADPRGLAFDHTASLALAAATSPNKEARFSKSGGALWDEGSLVVRRTG